MSDLTIPEFPLSRNKCDFLNCAANQNSQRAKVIILSNQSKELKLCHFQHFKECSEDLKEMIETLPLKQLNENDVQCFFCKTLCELGLMLTSKAKEKGKRKNVVPNILVS